MADKSINQLPVSDGLSDDGLLVVYQNGATKSITGSLVKQFATQGLESALTAAKESGEFDGQDGKDGTDGVSPTITVTDITGGHRLTIKDANGTQTVDIMDGEDGADGTGGTGSGGGDMLASTYDPQGKKRDIFAYVDNEILSVFDTSYVIIDLVANTGDTDIDTLLDEYYVQHKYIYARCENDDTCEYCQLPLVYIRGSGFIDGVSYPAQAKFAAVFKPDDDSQAPYVRVITLTEGDDILHPDAVVNDYPLAMPTVTAEDEGKLLQVVNGTWAAVAITDGNNVAY